MARLDRSRPCAEASAAPRLAAADAGMATGSRSTVPGALSDHEPLTVPSAPTVISTLAGSTNLIAVMHPSVSGACAHTSAEGSGPTVVVCAEALPANRP